MPRLPTKAPEQLDDRMLDVLKALTRHSTLEGVARALELTTSQVKYTLAYLRLYFGVQAIHRIVHQAYLRRLLEPTVEGYEERRKNQPKLTRAQMEAVVALAKSESMDEAGSLIHRDSQTIKSHVYAIWRKWRLLGIPNAQSQHRLIHLMWEYGYFWHKGAQPR
jgi:hypothetical protein